MAHPYHHSLSSVRKWGGSMPAGTSWSYEFLRARGNTIEGGTTEVLKNIVAERVLGLPRLKVAA